MGKPRLLFVCLGNICRSPAAEGILRRQAQARSIEVHVDSAGTGGWHVGNPPDERMQAAALRAGYDLSDLRARRFSRNDFDEFDVIYAMDRSNRARMEALRPAGADTTIELFRSHDPEPGHDVPDPYFEGGFDSVVRLIERTCMRILDTLERANGADRKG